ncbi:TonB-dependent receptor [Caulobacter sp.]|uniref:TonB-dependent receptor domain-containing protein n=1 Tax=Caulobacter sp. TaxID=78 RepID=UPI0025C5CA8C|nr:TonB-dependent receptor [Caulobacter sp.]
MASTVACGSAAAQTSPAPASPPAAQALGPPTAGHEPSANTVGAVTIKAADPDYKSFVDRRSYGLKNDIVSSTGSIADALRNIPSVEVDVQGNVSLRGESGVKVYIDGKPAGMLQGAGRGDALLQLPASQFERVEVMTNPSAAYRADGAAGIINLVSKKAKGVGVTGSVRGAYGTDGRYNGRIAIGQNTKRLSFSASAGGRRDNAKLNPRTDREILDPTTGAMVHTRAVGQAKTTNTSWNAQANIAYQPNAKTDLSADISQLRLNYHSPSAVRYASDAASGPLAEAYNSQGRNGGLFANTAASASLVRRLGGEGHQVSLDLSRTRSRSFDDSRQTYLHSRPVVESRFLAQASDEVQHETSAKVEYQRPTKKGLLDVGFEGRFEDERVDHRGALGASAAVASPSPSLNNQFDYRQNVQSAFLTYERSVGDWTLLPGARLEAAQRRVHQLTLGTRATRDDVRLFPTLHAVYAIDDEQKLNMSFSRRIQRPEPSSLNGFRQFVTPVAYEEGNPDLAPKITDAAELGYEFKRKSTSYLATLYARRSRDAVTDVVSDLGDGVLLTRKENAGRSRNLGLELVASRRVGKSMAFNISGNASWDEIAWTLNGREEKRSGATVGGRSNLNWQIGPKDLLQLNLVARGRTLLPQGYRRPSANLNLGYRHIISPKLAAVVTVQDAFDTYREGLVIDTPALRQRTDKNMSIRAAFVSLTYTLGGGKRRSEGFDYGEAAAQ